MWGRRRLGADVFLGEVVIPLREVGIVASSGAAPEPQTYTLGRRSAREKVVQKALMLHRHYQCIQFRQKMSADLVLPSSVDMHGSSCECKGLYCSCSEVLACLPWCLQSYYRPSIATRTHESLFQVAGELRLACGWRVTPFDVATMRLRAALQEAEHKEEVAALLLERVTGLGGHQGLDATTSLRRRADRDKAWTGSGHADGRNAGAARPVSLPMLRGRLDIKVRGRKLLLGLRTKSCQTKLSDGNNDTHAV